MNPSSSLNKISPIFLLRVGLGAVFLYAALGALLDPSNWVSFVPAWVGALIAPSTFLIVHGAFELMLALALLFGFFLPAASLLAFFDLAAILVFYGTDSVTFRDFGLALASLALFALVMNSRQRKTE